jgi:hypothetical protein
MPRKSAAALAVVRSSPSDGRLTPPAGLSAAELELWHSVVDSKPSDWFAEDSAPVLMEYIRAAVVCNRLAPLVDAALADGDPKAVDDLLRARDRESRRVASLATKLRLTQQSRYTPQGAGRADKKAKGARPWQTG